MSEPACGRCASLEKRMLELQRELTDLSDCFADVMTAYHEAIEVMETILQREGQDEPY